MDQNTTSGTCHWCSRQNDTICRKAVTPSMTGMRQSSKTTAWWHSSKAFSACLPLSATSMLKEGNADGRFTTIAQAKRIPLVEFEKTIDLIPALEKLFAK